MGNTTSTVAERKKQALRDNLRRRKAQLRGLGSTGDGGEALAPRKSVPGKSADERKAKGIETGAAANPAASSSAHDGEHSSDKSEN